MTRRCQWSLRDYIEISSVSFRKLYASKTLQIRISTASVPISVCGLERNKAWAEELATGLQRAFQGLGYRVTFGVAT